MGKLKWVLISILLLTLLVLPRVGQSQISATELDQLEEAAQAVDKSKELAPFVPTPMEVVEKMLELARVTSNDLVYDLGSGDGRIIITAAKKYVAGALGFEIDPELVQESRAIATKAGVGHLVEIREQDLMTADFSKLPW